MSLGKTITLLLVGLLVGTSILVGSVAYFTTRSSLVSLRDSLMEQIDRGVQQKMQSYFDGVEPTIRFMDEAVFNRPSPIDQWEEPATILARYLKTEPEIVYIYYAERDTGDLLGARRMEDNRTIVTRLHEDEGPNQLFYEVQPDGSIDQVILPGVSTAPYDARSRLWFREAVKLEGLVWTAPYEFLSSSQLGITAALAKRDSEGRVLGVFAADFVLDELAKFLDNLEVGRTGAAFLMLEDGSFPIPVSSRMHSNGELLRDAMESQSWDLSEVMVGGSMEHHFSFRDESYTVLIKQIDLPGETKYYSGGIVPDSDYLDVVWQNARTTIIAAGSVLIIAAFLGVWLARRVTEPLEQIGDELEQIGKLRFSEEDKKLRSRIREVSLFSDSVGKMKVSLKAFSRYVPRDLVRQLLSRGDEAQLGGTIQSITVVFTDLAGFTKMSEGMPADLAFRELSQFLEIIANTQQLHGGVTSSFTGDGTLALFNAPEPLEDHGLKACLAAWDCLSELKNLNKKRKEDGKQPFKARIGINTADVLLGNLGTPDRFAYTAIGDGVNLASRIEGLNKLYSTEILVGEPTRQAASDAFEWRKVDKIAVVGRTQPSILYQPLGRKGEVSEKLIRCRDLYEEALALYFEGKFSSAEKAFSGACQAEAADLASAVMAERCRAYQESAPSKDWDGIYLAPFK